MSVKVQVIGGAFQDATGAPLALGNLTFQLSQDAQVLVGSTYQQVDSGTVISVPLDSNGNIVTSPAQLIWPNDVLVPANTFYTVSAYAADGQLVWGPNSQQVLSTPSPFDVGAWVPGSINLLYGNVITYDVAAYFPGTYLANQTVLLLPIERTIRFSQSLSPSTASCGTRATSSFVLSCLKNGTQFATITFNSTSNTGLLVSASGATFQPGDVLTITTPSSPDATLANVGIILSATTLG